ncbi:hypothetical protein NE237_010120 [Protea cynaroides]|uniref:Glycoside hydrolase family 31 TIM barrel domain-containing protein n=1 Tax=Protea cynaroides TaxID=273540 RepID=A0A9Q0KZ73_9MAGN|nr:hypothetical protein NE237_010120 [Protea cynaroides]
MADDINIKYEGKHHLAQVWPSPVYFTDYLNPKTVSWWTDEITRFHQLVPVDGLRIDMNEASNFCTGKCQIPTDWPCPGTGAGWDYCLDCKNITKTRWDDPPCKINASGIEASIAVAPLSVHLQNSTPHSFHNALALAHHPHHKENDADRRFIAGE